MHKQRIVIVGGGAAGFFGALQLVENEPDADVMILEASNRLLSKVRVSGGGRCNVTHQLEDEGSITSYYPRGKQELRQVFARFSVQDVVEWFRAKGVRLKAEEDGRMFPESNSSQTIVNCFLDEAGRRGIQIRREFRVADILKTDVFRIISETGEEVVADKVLVTAGGHATASHYSFLKHTGHQLVLPVPSLFTFNIPDKELIKLMGISVPEVRVNIPSMNISEMGSLLITHWGFSGPAILKLSSAAARMLHDAGYRFKLEVQWSMQDEDNWHTKLAKSPGSQLKNAECGFPQRLWHYLIRRAGVNLEKRCADISKTEWQTLMNVLFKDAYAVDGKTTFKEEFVTCGGISLKEVDMRTLESKLLPGLYFAGEILDIDGYTGGFNFQAAWSTASVAARGMIASK